MATAVLRFLWLLCVFTLVVILSPLNYSAIAETTVVYGDKLAAGWENWSWDTTADFAAVSPVHSGADSISVTYTAAWGGLYLATNSPVGSGVYDTLQFWVHGGSTGGQKVSMMLADGSDILPG